MFFTSSSPVVADAAGGKLVIVPYGGGGGGGVVAYDLAGGARKWAWKGDGADYGSPALLTVDGTPVVVVPTSASVVALNPADGSLLWQTPFPTQRMVYNAASPVVAGDTMIYSGSGGRGRGTKAFRFEKAAGGAAAKEVWKTGDMAVQFNTPVLKDGRLYGISDEGQLFCMGAESGKVNWTAPLRRPTGGRVRPGYGSVVDAGTVLFVLNPSGELVVFEPTDKEFKKVASYQVATGDTFAYPVIADKRLFIKDKNTVTLWTIE
jgi:outer membrane protein assembly factor BamB